MAKVLERSRNVTAILVDRQIAETQGNRCAFSYHEQHYTFHELAALMNRAGNMFRSLGIERGQAVLLLLPPSPAFFATMLGAMKIGAVPVALNEDPTAERVRVALEQGRPAAVVLDGARLDDLSSTLYGLTIVVAGQSAGGHPSLVDRLREAPSSLASVKVEESAPALVLLTDQGASTISHGQLTQRAEHEAPLGVEFGGHDLGFILARLSRCEEVVIAPNV